jgi:hypothetical protein
MSKPKEKAKTTAKTRCEQGPPQDIVPQYIPRAKTTDVIEFSLLICKANSQALVYLDANLLTKADGQDQVSLILPKLPLGFHQLYWSVLGVGGKEWQTRAEIKISSVVSFLRRRKNSDNNPALTGFWVVEII